MSKITPKMTMKCDDCGVLTMAYLHGYEVGDVLLEGVRFEITFVKGKVVATTSPDDKDYMEGLNEKKWLKEAASFAKDDNCCLECPQCGTEVYPVWE